MDDILLYSLVAQSQQPGRLSHLVPRRSRLEPYGMMLRKDDPQFKKVVDDAMSQLYKSGEINEDLRQVVPEARSRRRAST